MRKSIWALAVAAIALPFQSDAAVVTVAITFGTGGGVVVTGGPAGTNANWDATPFTSGLTSSVNGLSETFTGNAGPLTKIANITVADNYEDLGMCPDTDVNCRVALGAGSLGVGVGDTGGRQDTSNGVENDEWLVLDLSGGTSGNVRITSLVFTDLADADNEGIFFVDDVTDVDLFVDTDVTSTPPTGWTYNSGAGTLSYTAVAGITGSVWRFQSNAGAADEVYLRSLTFEFNDTPEPTALALLGMGLGGLLLAKRYRKQRG